MGHLNFSRCSIQTIIKKAFESINRVISDAYVGNESFTVTGHINRGRLQKEDRKKYTEHTFKIVGDRNEFDEEVRNEDIAIP